MSEQNQEIKQEVVTPTEEVVEQVQEPQYSDIETRAMEMGWKPKEQFSGNEDDFIDAKEFVRRQPLFDKIEAQSKQLKTLTRTLNELKEHYTKVNEAAYDRAIAVMRAERKEALSAGDGDRFEQLDDQIKEAEEQKRELDALRTTTPVEPEVHPEFVSWKTRNKWYDSVGYMRVFADQVGVRLHQQGLEPAAVLAEVEKAVKKEFPDKFKNPNKDTAPNLEKGGNSTKGGKESVELTDVERKIMNDFVRQNIMTKEEYIKSLKSVKGRA